MILAQVETPEASTFAFLCKAKIKQAKGFFLALKSASPFCKTSFSNQIKPNSLAKKMQNSILQRRIHQHNFPLQNTKLSLSPWLSSSFPMIKSVGGSLRGYLNIQHPPTPEKLNFCLWENSPKCCQWTGAHPRHQDIKRPSQIIIIVKQESKFLCKVHGHDDDDGDMFLYSVSAQRWPVGSTTGATCVLSSNFLVITMMIDQLEIEMMIILMLMILLMMLMIIIWIYSFFRAFRFWLPEGE